MSNAKMITINLDQHPQIALKGVRHASFKTQVIMKTNYLQLISLMIALTFSSLIGNSQVKNVTETEEFKYMYEGGEKYSRNPHFKFIITELDNGNITFEEIQEGWKVNIGLSEVLTKGFAIFHAENPLMKMKIIWHVDVCLTIYAIHDSGKEVISTYTNW